MSLTVMENQSDMVNYIKFAILILLKSLILVMDIGVNLNIFSIHQNNI